MYSYEKWGKDCGRAPGRAEGRVGGSWTVRLSVVAVRPGGGVREGVQVPEVGYRGGRV